MFPLRYISIKPLVPEVHFGGEEVPPYLTAPVTHLSDIPDLVASIRALAISSPICGYIDSGGIFFHIPEEESFHVDGSRPFLFLGHNDPLGRHFLDPLGILNFLQEPCERFLFVSPQCAILIEKTQATYELCLELDQIRESEEFGEKICVLFTKGIDADQALLLLMNTFETARGAEPSQMWSFWDTFAFHLMQDRLGLKVTLYDEEN